MDLNAAGRVIIALGLVLIILGGILLLLSRISGLKNLGSLPGDFRIESGGLTCFFPIVTMILISVLLSLALNIAIRILNR